MATPATLTAIEARRKELGLTVSDLCRQAGCSTTGYYAGLGRGSVRPATIARLGRALGQLSTGRLIEANTLAPAACYRLLLVHVSYMMDVDPVDVLSAEPQLRATNDKSWMQAASCRRIALHVFNGALGFRMADIARASGMTRAAVSLAIKQIEDQRETDAQLNDLLDTIYEVLT